MGRWWEGGWMGRREGEEMRVKKMKGRAEEGEGRGRGGQRKGREKQQSRITGLEVSYL